jgi:hypothetical protein
MTAVVAVVTAPAMLLLVSVIVPKLSASGAITTIDAAATLERDTEMCLVYTNTRKHTYRAIANARSLLSTYIVLQYNSKKDCGGICVRTLLFCC